MKNIQPITIWLNGKLVNASLFKLICNNDNLINEATFYYSLFDSDLLQLNSGYLTMNLPNYIIDWQTNDAAYNWAATQLGLTITGEYVPPVPPVSEIIDPVTE